MIRLSRADKNSRGFTLVELLIVSAVLSLVLTSLCGIYLSVAAEWERQDGRGTALSVTSMACSRVSDYLSQAVGAVVLTRFEEGDAIAVNLPANSAHGIYVPVWNAGRIEHQSGNWIVFYLSDSTGDYRRTGDILWAATMNWSTYPNGVVPDSAWSLYQGQSKGKISPISSLQFSVADDGLPLVTVIATSAYKVGDTNDRIKLTRSVCVQNAY